VFGALVEPIRGIKLALVSGLAWLAAGWLIFGGAVLDALGKDCGAATSSACTAQQSQTAHVVVVASSAFGPVGATAALAIVATLVGGTANFAGACLAAAVWRPKDDGQGARKRKRRELIDLLMGWATPIDLVDHAEWNSEWQEAQRIRGEGLTRITTFPALVAIACTLALRVSPFYWTAVVLVAAVLAHGVAAIIRSTSMYADLREKRAMRARGDEAAAVPTLFDEVSRPDVS
jgi:hypothetical protein